MKTIFCAVLLMLVAVVSMYGARESRYPDSDSPHFLYLPQEIDPARTYWLVVGVHGAGGRNQGASGMAAWADQKDNVMVIGPKFGNAYQNANPEDQELLIDLFQRLQKDYRLHPKMFIYGFSGGSQFAHRFAMKQPDVVCGVSSHSGGSWATDGYGEVKQGASHIPFAVSCGEKDTGKAWGEAPYNRLEWYKRFENELARGGFFYRGATWPNVGHGASSGVREMTEECFQLATRGLLPGTEPAAQLAQAAELAAAGKFDEAQAIKVELSRRSVALPADFGWHDNQKALAVRKGLIGNALAEIDTSPVARRVFSLYVKCLGLLKSETKPGDEVLLAFVDRCPPATWKGKPDSETVLKACDAAAARRLATLKARNQLNIRTCQVLFERWEGLATREDLLKEYDAEAQKQLDKVLAMKAGSIQQRALKNFVQHWKVGESVGKAQALIAR